MPVVTQISWGQRIRNAFLGIICGIVLIFGSIYFIFSNEKTSLYTSISLKQTARVVVNIDASPIDPNNNKKVVAFHGNATTSETLQDDFLNISVNAIRLSRHVEMYQWQEKSHVSTESNLGGSQTETTTYTYYKDWFTSVINSTRFNVPTDHSNPDRMPINSIVIQAQDVMVGDFRLPKSLIDQMNGKVDVDLSKVDTSALQTKFNRTVTHDGNYLYVGNDPNTPAVGDIRIDMTKVPQQEVSIIAQQIGNTLQAYIPPGGQPVALLTLGESSAQDMLTVEENKNNTNTWLIRLGTLVALVIGFALILQPIVVLADVVPIFGTIVGAGIFLVAFTLGASVWLVFTAIAWFFVRPIMSIGLMIIAIIIAFLIYKLHKRKEATPTKPT